MARPREPVDLIADKRAKTLDDCGICREKKRRDRSPRR